MWRCTIAFGLLAAVLLVCAAKDAQACGSGSGRIIGFGFVSTGEAIGGSVAAGANLANVIYTVSDIKRRGKLLHVDGVGEVATMIPAVLVGLATVGTSVAMRGGKPGFEPSTDGVLIAGAIQTVWSAGLLAHGAYVMRTAPESEGERGFRAQRRTLAVAPTMVSDGKENGVGLGAMGRF